MFEKNKQTKQANKQKPSFTSLFCLLLGQSYALERCSDCGGVENKCRHFVCIWTWILGNSGLENCLPCCSIQYWQSVGSKSSHRALSLFPPLPLAPLLWTNSLERRPLRPSLCKPINLLPGELWSVGRAWQLWSWCSPVSALDWLARANSPWATRAAAALLRWQISQG